jgi:hypothetical protein
VGDDGHVSVYTSIHVYLKEVATEVTNAVEDKLTQEQKDRIGFNREQFRERQEKAFADYKEQNTSR